MTVTRFPCPEGRGTVTREESCRGVAVSPSTVTPPSSAPASKSGRPAKYRSCTWSASAPTGRSASTVPFTEPVLGSTVATTS